MKEQVVSGLGDKTNLITFSSIWIDPTAYTAEMPTVASGQQTATQSRAHSLYNKIWLLDLFFWSHNDNAH